MALTRAAASSRASGIPSSLRAISPTAPAFAGLSSNSGLASRARSTKSRTASLLASPTRVSTPGGAGTGRGGTGQVISPSTSRGSRLVARRRTSWQRRTSWAAAGAIAGRRCSQLSSKMSADLVSRCPHTVSVSEASGRGLISSPRAMVPHRRPSSAIPPRSTNQAPSAQGMLAAAFSASLVFPTPPGPVSVSSLARASRDLTRSSSPARPTKLVS
jgi:hypothetical protein